MGIHDDAARIYSATGSEYITDDFENVDQMILRESRKIGAKCGLTIGRSEVVEAIRALVGAGLARAYELSGPDPFSGGTPRYAAAGC